MIITTIITTTSILLTFVIVRKAFFGVLKLLRILDVLLLLLLSLILLYCRCLYYYYSACYFCCRLVETICASGASPNQIEEGASPMHIVVGLKRKNVKQLTNILLQYGGDPNVEYVHIFIFVWEMCIFSLYLYRILYFSASKARCVDIHLKSQFLKVFNTKYLFFLHPVVTLTEDNQL